MNLPLAITTVRCLARDTFRQALASGLFWLMASITLLGVVFCLSVTVEGDANLQPPPDDLPELLPNHPDFKELAKQENLPVPSGNVTLAFGAIRAPLGRDRHDAVRFIQYVLAEWVADAGGLLLALIWTAGFLPAFLEPSNAAVLLAKPTPRWALLAGKYVGVLAFVAVMASAFIGGTWLALGLATGVWDGRYLLAVPMLVLHFAIFYSFSVLLAVASRSTVVCVFGAIVFWMLCWGMNFGRHYVVTLPEFESMRPAMKVLVEVGYWTLPKPGDQGIILAGLLDAGRFASPVPAFTLAQQQGHFHLELSLLTSVLFALVMLACAAREFVIQDY